jgi:hypothetical protein
LNQAPIIQTKENEISKKVYNLYQQWVKSTRKFYLPDPTSRTDWDLKREECWWIHRPEMREPSQTFHPTPTFSFCSSRSFTTMGSKLSDVNVNVLT